MTENSLRPAGEDSGTFDRLMERPSRWRGVRAKLVGTYLLVAAISVVLALLMELFGVPGTEFAGSIEVHSEEARDRLDREAAATVDQIALRLKEKEGQIIALARNDLVDARVERILAEIGAANRDDVDIAECWRDLAIADDYSDLHSLFRALVDKTDGPRSAWIVERARGTVVLATDIEDLGLDVSQRPFLHDLFEGKGAGPSGLCSCGETKGLKNIVIAVAVGGSSAGRPQAFLVTHFNPDRVLGPVLTSMQSLGSSVEAFAIDENGTLLTSVQHLSRDGSYLRPLHDRMTDRASVLAADGREGWIRCRDYRGQEVQAAFRSIPINKDQRWGLVIKRDHADIIAPIRREVQRVVWASAAALLLLTAVGIFVAGTVIRPLLDVARAAYRISEGDLGARAEVATSDEVGALATIFNAMAHRIQIEHGELERRAEDRNQRLVEAMEALETEVEERRRTEMSLLESEARFRAVLEDAPLMLCRFTMDGEITFANRLYSDFFRGDRTGVVGRKIQEFTPEADFDEMMQELETATPDRPTMSRGYALRRRDGSEIWIHWTNRMVFDDEGTILSIVAVGEDLTEKMIAERKFKDLTLHLEDRVDVRTSELRRRVAEVEKLNRAVLNLADDVGRKNEDLANAVRQTEEANEELESFAYSVSHDLRAPLRHIAGFVKILEDTAGENLEPEHRRYLRLVAEAAARMGRLIDDLLAFSRTRRLEMRPVEVDLGEMVSEAIREVVERAGEREIVWEVGPLPSVLADRTSLLLAVVNLIDNAVKYTGTRERAEIEIGSETDDEGKVVVWVKDNGVGFDPKFAHRLFGVFQRLHRAEEFEGTGIGLANVRRVISRHGGKTWAEGEIGKGATFYFSLPPSEESSSGDNSLPHSQP